MKSPTASLPHCSSAFGRLPSLALLGLGLFGPALAVHAQAVPPPSTAPAPKDSEVVQLNPFTVNSADDVGYQAGNTLSGSRFNTKLSETPASVSVFTEEFLKDLGAVNLAGVLEYGVNANADFNAVSTAPSFAYLDGGLLNDVRVNVRGISASKTLDFLETTMPTDSYNTGRFDVSSGPNSVLFGFGSAGGIVNASTRQADFRRASLNLTQTAASWDSYRTEIDFNIVPVKDKVAARIMAVHDQTAGWKRFSDAETNRLTAVLGYKPFKNTTLSAIYEVGAISGPTTRPYNRMDSLSYWWRQGHQIVDNTSFGTSTTAVQNAYGIRGSSVRNVWVSNDGRPTFARTGSANTVMYESASIYETGVASGIPTQLQESGSYQTLLPTKPRADGLPYSPYDVNYYGPEAVRHNDISRIFVRGTQQLGRDGFLELAYAHEYGTGDSNQLSGDFVLYGDPNRYVPNPDGTATRVANPHAGQLYVEQDWYYNTATTKNDVFRATLSWKANLGRWGEHRLAGLAEHSVNDATTSQGAEILVNSQTKVPILFPTAPENGQNGLFRRNYVNPDDPSTFIPGSRLDDRAITFGGVTYTPRIAYNANDNGAKRTIDSVMAATQSRFFKDRLIVTGGIRQDNVEIVPYRLGRLTADDPHVLSGERLVNEYSLLGRDYSAVQHYTFDTFTAGAVLGVTKWLSGFYNQSNNNGAPQTVRRILPDASFPIPPEGKGRDYGLIFNLLDGRIFARATAFDTQSKNDPSVRDNTFIVAHRRIITAYRDNGLITQAEADARSLPLYLGDFMSDLTTKGYEFELKASPTKNWTVTMAYSYTKLDRTNLGQEWYAWFADQKAYYAKFPSTLLTTANIPISREITQIETGVENLFDLNKIGYNNRPHKANMFTRYSFDEGMLKGVFIGGGVRWQDKNVLQRQILGSDALGKDVLGKILYGPTIFNVDALIGYSTRLKSGVLGRGTTLRVQLNIANALDSDAIQIVRLNRVGDGYWRVVTRDPRSYRLSTTLGF